MSIIWCLLAFFLGLGTGWVIFKHSDCIEDEDEDELDEYRQHIYCYESSKKDEDAVSDAGLCNGCVNLACSSPQDSQMAYEWKCLRTGNRICATSSQFKVVRRPGWCAEKDD